jgi:hypothetical protein
MNRSMTQRAALFSVLFAFLLVSGCTLSGDAPEPKSVEKGEAQVATVAERTITDAVSLDATAQAGVTYILTAATSGSLVVTGMPESDTDKPIDPRRHSFALVTDSGKRSEIPVPQSAKKVLALTPPGVSVKANTPILQVTDSAIILKSEPTPEQVLRIGNRTPKRVRAQVKGSSGPFDCTPTDRRLSFIKDTFQFTCRVPSTTPIVVGASAKAVLVLETKDNVPALPVEAIAGTISNGSVFRAKGEHEQVQVKLGISDGVYIEILSGLKVGDQVAIPSPSLLDGDDEPAD